METESPNVFFSPNSSESAYGSASSKGKVRLSEIRYTPTRKDEEGQRTFMLDICQDSLEIPKPKSRLIEFTQIRDGEDKPRQVIMPLFFHNKDVNKHQRQASLKPVNTEKESPISKILMNFREKPQPRSSLKKTENLKKPKTVSFCSQIDLSSPESVLDSVIFIGEEKREDSFQENSGKSGLATTANTIIQENWEKKSEKAPETTSSTQQNIEIHDDNEIIFELNKSFPYEEEVRTSIIKREEEFNEFSTIAYCKVCQREIVTAVSFEKVKGQGCVDVTQWILCWILPACMYKNKKLVHKCPFCADEIAKIDC